MITKWDVQIFFCSLSDKCSPVDFALYSSGGSISSISTSKAFCHVQYLLSELWMSYWPDDTAPGCALCLTPDDNIAESVLQMRWHTQREVWLWVTLNKICKTTDINHQRHNDNAALLLPSVTTGLLMVTHTDPFFSHPCAKCFQRLLHARKTHSHTHALWKWNYQREWSDAGEVCNYNNHNLNCTFGCTPVRHLHSSETDFYLKIPFRQHRCSPLWKTNTTFSSKVFFCHILQRLYRGLSWLWLCACLSKAQP